MAHHIGDVDGMLDDLQESGAGELEGRDRESSPCTEHQTTVVRPMTDQDPPLGAETMTPLSDLVERQPEHGPVVLVDGRLGRRRDPERRIEIRERNIGESRTGEPAEWKRWGSSSPPRTGCASGRRSSV